MYERRKFHLDMFRLHHTVIILQWTYDILRYFFWTMPSVFSIAFVKRSPTTTMYSTQIIVHSSTIHVLIISEASLSPQTTAADCKFSNCSPGPIDRNVLLDGPGRSWAVVVLKSGTKILKLFLYQHKNSSLDVFSC